MAAQTFQKIQNSVLWNLFLITIGVTLFSVGVKGVALHQNFIASGIFGTGMLIFYATEMLSPSFWYFVLNVPIFILGWVCLSRRFVYYSIYGILATTVISELINCNLGIKDPFVAALTTGMLCGAGLGIVLRSLGSDGGLTIISIILHEKFNLRMGQVNFAYNLVLFGFALTVIETEQVMYSLVSIFIASSIIDYFVSLFNNRKMAIIISDHHEAIAEHILKRLGRGVTYLHASGAFTKREKNVILTVVQNYQIKRLEEAVFNVDPNAFVIIDNTFNVLGSGFSARKRY